MKKQCTREYINGLVTPTNPVCQLNENGEKKEEEEEEKEEEEEEEEDMNEKY